MVTLTGKQATRISGGHLTPIRFRADGWPGRLVKGPKGPSLSFDGVDPFAESTYRGISGNKPRAVPM